jgi:SAM-dependent methyltransferase
VRTADRLLSTSHGRCASDARKFLLLNDWLAAVTGRVSLLEIDHCSPLAILDLGTGTGLFPFVCENCGHAAMGLDLPAEVMPDPERRIFSLMPDAFGVAVERRPIRAFAPIEGIGTYDLVTGFRVSFNDHKKPDEWGRAEWEYFITDLRKHLNPGGRIVLTLNANVERYGSKLRYYDEDTRDFLAAMGSVYGAAVIIPSARGASEADWRRQLAMEALIGTRVVNLRL